MSIAINPSRIYSMQVMADIEQQIVHGLVEQAMSSIRVEVESRVLALVRDMEPEMRQMFQVQKAQAVFQFSIREAR